MIVMRFVVAVTVALTVAVKKACAPGEARSLDLRIISTALYPTKLQGQQEWASRR